MEDRELLEMAAKAAGLHSMDSLAWKRNPDGTWNNFLDCEGRRWRVWNPLKDDGDAFRLAQEMGMCVDFGGGIIIYDDDVGNEMEFERPPNAANVRRAIVRAAAEIGKAMP